MTNEKRLIDANALESRMGCLCDEFSTDHLFIDAIVYEIGNAPTVDAVEVVHGYWVVTPVKKLNGKGKVVHYCDFYHCSECGTDMPIVPPYNYCPGCGAKMDGERNEQS